ncbi:MAG: hypothetical protein GY717_12960 [Rhodobacteraceae bacterium]|nr:hypothetical protein [Paracoccaceae bacterium]
MGKLNRGDLILEVDGTPVIDANSLIAPVSAGAPGSRMLFRLLRDGGQIVVAAELGGHLAGATERAEAGSANDLVLVASAYRTGYGAKQDLAQAVDHYRLAWEAGSLEGGYWLARCYDQGWGVTQDRSGAADLMRKVADQNYPPAQAPTAFFILTGIGGEDNPLLALVCADAAATADNAFGLYMMGYISEGVEGIPGSDIELAIGYYRRAAQRGIEGALQNLERLGEPVYIVAEVQTQLKRLGLYAGRPDGVVGSGTRRAIRTFERLVGLPETGEIGAVMARRLTKVIAGTDYLAEPEDR